MKTTNSTVGDIDTIRTEYENLYKQQIPTEPDIPTYVNFCVDDDAPTEKEIVKALKRLKNRKSPGASGISVENLKTWYKDAIDTEKNNYDAIKIWNNILHIIRIAFVEGKVPTAFTQAILVLIPKQDTRKFRGIALLETIYKLISMIIHLRLIKSIEFHDGIHGFRTNRGTSTAIINIKLRMQLARQLKEPLYLLFLDLTKAYDSLDRQRTIQLLENYGVGQNIRTLINNMWKNDTIIPKQQQFYGKEFKAERGVRQGDVVSPTIFNIVIDAVIRNCYHRLEENGDYDMIIQFYADDGIIAGKDYEKVQEMLDFIVKDFLAFGLELN